MADVLPEQRRPRTARTPSSDSLSTVASQPTSPGHSLRKRHSNYMRVSDRSTSPIPELPPQRPPRNPARSATSIQTPKVSSRPSSSKSAREDVTPWDFQPVPGPDVKRRLRSGAPSVKSRASSNGLGGALTGPVEEVTPWELFQAPEPEPSSRAPSLSNVHLAQTPAPPSPKTLHPIKATGLVEDVTPWELHPDPSTPDAPPVTIVTSASTVLSRPRSKPASILSNSSVNAYRASTATGPTEEVTPWELQPFPDIEQIAEKASVHSGQRNSMSMSKAQLEEVMPWELHPPPPVPALNSVVAAPVRKSTVASRSNAASSRTLADFGLVRHRRSTGSRASKTRSQSSNPSKSQSRTNSSQAISNNNSHDVLHESPRTYTPSLPRTDSLPARGSSALSSHTSKLNSNPKQKTPRFSTADRTILEELKRNIHARAAQFVVKGVGVHLTDESVSLGKRHHPYSMRDVPYPRSYDREVIDLDVWETLFCQEICESLTWHVFEEPPMKVLDIGCGTGTWIMKCAHTWRDTQFVGLDIVPLQPDLQQVGSIDYASRITWVQANFLETLPFPNEEFDFVHIKRIALGVPEDKWDALFDEISRVMKPGAAFEMVEEDLFFPGKRPEDEKETDPASPISRASSIGSLGGCSDTQQPPKSLDSIPQPNESSAVATPTLSAPGLIKVPSRSGSDPEPAPRVSFSQEVDTADIRSHASTTPPGSPRGYVTLIAPHSRSSARPTLYVRTNHSAGFSFASTSPPKSHNSSLFTDSAVSLLNSLAHHSSDSDHHLFRRRRSSTNLSSANDFNTPGPDTAHNQGAQSHPQHHAPSHSMDSGRVNGRPASVSLKTEPMKNPPPFLLRTPAKPPMNPRDHSLLEYIYHETLSSRFINASPLSLLTTYLEYHFKDARSHPPLLYTFPPVPVKADIEFDSDIEDEDALTETIPPQYTNSRRSTASSQRSAFSNDNGELPEEHRWLSMQGLLRQSSPYVILDGARTQALLHPDRSTALLAAGSKDIKAPGKPRLASRLPNKTLNIDLRTLNLHLAIRAKEILACSESMWEWIHGSQKAWREENEAQRRRGRQSIEMPYRSHSSSGNPAQDHKNAVLEMTRDDFNQLLLNFEMDMQDQASLNTALKERFQWNVIESPPPPNRKIFTTACEKYDKWLRKENQSSISSSIRPSRHSMHSPSSINVTASTPDTAVPVEAQKAKTRTRSNSHTILMNRHGDPNRLSPTTPQRSDASVHFVLPSVLPSLATLAPTQKLSRSMCVFVAWKPDETASATKD